VEYREGAFNLLKLEPVGGYAMQMTWADGHASGIYSYEYLRKLAAMPQS
jgi:prepilin-type processing-associated H-X9-DG protein